MTQDVRTTTLERFYTILKENLLDPAVKILGSMGCFKEEAEKHLVKLAELHNKIVVAGPNLLIVSVTSVRVNQKSMHKNHKNSAMQHLSFMFMHS